MRVRPVASADFEAVTRLCELVFGRDVGPADQWVWKLERNPYAGRVEALGWVLESGGEVVGFLGNVPQLLWVGGREVTACFTTAYAVHSRFRFGGLQLAEAFARQECAELLGNATASAPAARIFARFGFVPVPGCDEVLYLPLDVVRFGQATLRRAGLSLRTSRLLGRLAGPLLSLYRWSRVRGPAARPSVETSTPPEALDALALVGRRWRDAYPVTNPRGREFLQWRLSEARSPHGTPAIILAHQDSRPIGYAVWRVRSPEAEYGWVRAELVDLCCSPDRPEVFDALVAEMAAQVRRSGATFLEVRFLSSAWRLRLREFGWLRRRTPSNPLLIRFKGSGGEAVLESLPLWHLTPLDGDAAF